LLKTRIQAGEDLDRSIEILARNLYRVIEAGVNTRYIRIIVYPSVNNIVAAIHLFKHIHSMGGRPVLTTSLKPFGGKEPLILLGFNSLNLKGSDIGDYLLAIASGEIKGNPPPGAVYLEVEGSISAAIGLALIEGKVPLRELAGLLAASYSGSYVDPAGRFHGLDRVFMERVGEDTYLNLSMYTGVKAYNPHKWSGYKSLSTTVNPYLPGLTGDIDGSREFLRAVGIDPEARLSTLANSDMEKLVSRILELAGRGRRVEATRIVGGVLVSNGSEYIDDLRMASDIYYYIIEAGGLETLAGLILDPRIEYPMADSKIIDYSRRLASLVEEVRPVKVKIAPRIKAYKIPLEKRDSPTLVWRAMELTGTLDRESILVYDGDDGLYASLVQVEEALGYNSARRLVELKVMEERGIELKVVQDAFESG